MQVRCCNCFQMYDEVGGMCPFCGHIKGEAGAELNYLVPGTTLNNGHYMVGQVLGAGGFGIVYRAWDTELNRMVAIKEYYPVQMVTRTPGERVLAVYSSKKESEYKRGLLKFQTEAIIMRKFKDSHYVCNAFDRFDENGTSYIVMEFLPKTLKNYAKEKGRLEEKEILEIAEEILLGLDEIHQKEVVHRDIAPDNIFLSDGKAKINDFGAAFEGKKAEADEDIALKPGYAPPEQYRANGKIGPWTDIYAAGATIYWLLTGKVPLEATDREREDTLQSPNEVAGTTLSVSNVVMRAMAVRPELRYKTAQEFIAELKKENARSVEAELKRRKRKRLGFLLAVAAVLVIAVFGGNRLRKEAGIIREDEITVWLSAEESAEDTQRKIARYEQVFSQFGERFPQIEIDIVVKEAEDMEDSFLALPKKERPDLLESTETGGKLLEMFSSLEKKVVQNRESLLNGVTAHFTKNGQQRMPVGMYVTVVYAEKGQPLQQKMQCTFEEFIESEGKGFCYADSSLYFAVQEELAARYQLLETEERVVILSDYFSVYKRSGNQEKAALALLEYMLTDAAQDVLHIQNHSAHMPVNQNAWNAYLEVYTEFDYLRKTLETDYLYQSETEYRKK